MPTHLLVISVHLPLFPACPHKALVVLGAAREDLVAGLGQVTAEDRPVAGSDDSLEGQSVWVGGELVGQQPRAHSPGRARGQGQGAQRGVEELSLALSSRQGEVGGGGDHCQALRQSGIFCTYCV